MRRSYWRHTAPYDAFIAVIIALLAWLAASITHGQITLTVVPGSGTFGKVLDATKYCTPNDDLDDTAGLISCLELRQSSEPVVVYLSLIHI